MTNATKSESIRKRPATANVISPRGETLLPDDMDTHVVSVNIGLKLDGRPTNLL